MADESGRSGRFGGGGRGRAAAAAAGAAVVLAVGGAALALGPGLGGGDKEPVGASKQPVGEPRAGEPAGGSGQAGQDRTTTTTGPDPLCAAHDTMAGTAEALGTIDGPADLEALVTAQLTFYTAAAESEPSPDGDAFAAMAAWSTATRDFFSARGWQQQVDPDEIALVPQPPIADGARTREILEERCGVVPEPDNPG